LKCLYFSIFFRGVLQSVIYFLDVFLPGHVWVRNIKNINAKCAQSKHEENS
jgi:hypothetical protein